MTASHPPVQSWTSTRLKACFLLHQTVSDAPTPPQQFQEDWYHRELVVEHSLGSLLRGISLSRRFGEQCLLSSAFALEVLFGYPSEPPGLHGTVQESSSAPLLRLDT